MWYLWQSLYSQGSALEQNMVAMRDKETTEKRFFELRAELTATLNERDELKKLVLSGDEGAVAFLTKYEKLASEIGVELNTKQLSVDQTPETGFDELKVEFGLLGNERQVMRMIQLLELMPYDGRLVSLNLKRTTDPTIGQKNLDVAVTLKVSILE